MDNLLHKTPGDLGLYWDIKVTSEDEDEMIGKIAKTIHKNGLNLVAIFMIGSVRPLTFIGAQMGRFFVSPFLPAFGEDIEMSGKKLFQIFEKRENVEKLIKAVEDLTREEEDLKTVEKTKKLKEKKAKMAERGEPERQGWRRFLPF